MSVIPKNPDVFDVVKLTELSMAVMLGYGDDAIKDFTRERIFWLMDDRSQWLK